MSDTVRVKMDEVVNSIAMIAEYKATAELRIAALAACLDKYEKQLLDVQSQLIDRNTELFTERECGNNTAARLREVEALHGADRAEITRLQGLLSKLQLGGEPTRKQHRSALDARATAAEQERDALIIDLRQARKDNDSYRQSGKEQFEACIKAEKQRDGLLELACMICKSSMGETRPSRGESLIGWQKGDGVTADQVVRLAAALCGSERG